MVRPSSYTLHGCTQGRVVENVDVFASEIETYSIDENCHGIMLDDVIAADHRPRTLFEGGVERRTSLMTAIDEVNGRFGRSTRDTAAEGFKREWRMPADARSPTWTSRIDEAPVVTV